MFLVSIKAIPLEIFDTFVYFDQNDQEVDHLHCHFIFNQFHKSNEQKLFPEYQHLVLSLQYKAASTSIINMYTTYSARQFFPAF